MRASSSPTLTDSTRLHGIDLLRTMSFLAILIFHLSYALWAHHGRLDAIQSPLTKPFEVYARALVFSGFSVLLLSFFLFGFRGTRKWGVLAYAFLGFFVVWNLTARELVYVWDIYPFLLCALILVRLVREASPTWLMGVGALLVSIPFWKLEGAWPQPAWLEPMLIGRCAGQGLGDWPLLPWIGYPLFAFGLGRLAALHRSKLKTMDSRELMVWVALLAASIAWLGNYYVTPLGDQFSCYTFRRPPAEFWAHQLWILFGLRVSLLAAVEGRLASWSWVRWLSRRSVNRRFFLVYFAHYPLCLAVAALADLYEVTFLPVTYVAGFFAVLLMTEVVFRPGFGENILKRGKIWQKVSGKSPTT